MSPHRRTGFAQSLNHLQMAIPGSRVHGSAAISVLGIDVTACTHVHPATHSHTLSKLRSSRPVPSAPRTGFAQRMHHLQMAPPGSQVHGSPAKPALGIDVTACTHVHPGQPHGQPSHCAACHVSTMCTAVPFLTFSQQYIHGVDAAVSSCSTQPIPKVRHSRQSTENRRKVVRNTPHTHCPTLCRLRSGCFRSHSIHTHSSLPMPPVREAPHVSPPCLRTRAVAGRNTGTNTHRLRRGRITQRPAATLVGSGTRATSPTSLYLPRSE